ncbi:MAG TPA: cupin domain-containing protein [Gaiellaceae bacterium]|nr:cupin domain-containing protein [Gaiellaceae bacterium]
MTVAHWDEAKSGRPERAGLGGRWTNLGDAAGSRTVGVNRIQLDPGEVSTPAHVHGADEEIFFVLAGSGLSWQDGETHEVRAGDCLVHRPRTRAHTLRAGDDGLDVLAYGQRIRIGGAYLPKVGTYWLWPTWAEVAEGANPFDREQNLDWPEPSPRPDSIVHLDDVEGSFGGVAKRVGAAAGARQTGLNWVALPPNEEGAPPHCHSAEEELFVVLDGEGTLELWGGPQPGGPPPTEPQETHPVRRGSVVARPAGTRISHCFRAGGAGLTYLSYGTREPSDICYYPRSNKVFFRGLGVIARLEPLDYFDGEPS